MRLIIKITDDGDEYIATLEQVEHPIAGWREQKFTRGDGEDVMDALGDLVAQLSLKLDELLETTDKLKLARWNRNVLDWKHIQPVTPPTSPMELAQTL